MYALLKEKPIGCKLDNRFIAFSPKLSEPTIFKLNNMLNIHNDLPNFDFDP